MKNWSWIHFFFALAPAENIHTHNVDELNLFSYFISQFLTFSKGNINSRIANFLGEPKVVDKKEDVVMKARSTDNSIDILWSSGKMKNFVNFFHDFSKGINHSLIQFENKKIHFIVMIECSQKTIFNFFCSSEFHERIILFSLCLVLCVACEKFVRNSCINEDYSD